MTYIWRYLVLINLLTAAVYIWDKHQAVARRWRVPEARLLGLAAIGGALGALLAMQVWRHKTHKWPFALGWGIKLVLVSVKPMAWRFFHEISDCFQKVIQISDARALY